MHLPETNTPLIVCYLLGGPVHEGSGSDQNKVKRNVFGTTADVTFKFEGTCQLNITHTCFTVEALVKC